MKENKVDKFVENPRKALFTLTYPVLVAMLVQVMYNIVDTAFVGRLGVEAIAAMTFAFPIFFILMALTMGLGAGMSQKISRCLGAKNKKAAENAAMHGLLISFFLAVFVFAAGFLLLDDLFSLFGASESVLELSMHYMRIILIGVFFMFPSFALNSIFSAQGDTKTPMKVQIAALVLNIILDPIFIYVLGYGVRGAAIATVISFLFGLVLFCYYTRKVSYLHIHPESFKFSMPVLKNIAKVGAPATVTMLLLSMYVFFINHIMAHFGTEYIAVFGLVSRLESVAIMPISALAVALLTLVGMFYGAKRYDLLKDIVWYGVRAGVVFTAIVGVIFFIFPSSFLKIFTNDPALIALGVPYFRLDIFTFPLMAIGMLIGRVMQGMGLGIPGFIITSVRILVIAVPLAYIFVFVLNLNYLSVPIAMVFGGVIANIIAITWMKWKLNKLDS